MDEKYSLREIEVAWERMEKSEWSFEYDRWTFKDLKKQLEELYEHGALPSLVKIG